MALCSVAAVAAAGLSFSMNLFKMNPSAPSPSCSSRSSSCEVPEPCLESRLLLLLRRLRRMGEGVWEEVVSVARAWTPLEAAADEDRAVTVR